MKNVKINEVIACCLAILEKTRKNKVSDSFLNDIFDNFLTKYETEVMEKYSKLNFEKKLSDMDNLKFNNFFKKIIVRKIFKVLDFSDIDFIYTLIIENKTLSDLLHSIMIHYNYNNLILDYYYLTKIHNSNKVGVLFKVEIDEDESDDEIEESEDEDEIDEDEIDVEDTDLELEDDDELEIMNDEEFKQFIIKNSKQIKFEKESTDINTDLKIEVLSDSSIKLTFDNFEIYAKVINGVLKPYKILNLNTNMEMKHFDDVLFELNEYLTNNHLLIEQIKYLFINNEI